MRTIGSVLLLSVFLFLTGCGPRGETKTLSEVLNAAKAGFVTASAGVQDQQVKAQMSEMSATLEKIVGDSTGAIVSAGTISIADKLGELVKVAGYASRPAMGELALQYRTLSADASKGAVNPARVKLLAARTYSLLASELESTQFSVTRLQG